MTKYRLVRAPDGSWERVYELEDGTTASIPHVEALEGLVDQLGKLHKIKDADHAEHVESLKVDHLVREEQVRADAPREAAVAHGKKKAGKNFDARAKAVQASAEAMKKNKPSLGLDEARADAVAEWNQKRPRKRPFTVAALKRALSRIKKRAG